MLRLRPGLAACLLAVLSTATARPASSDLTNWRVWNTEDGMIEGYISQLSRTPDGRIVIRNGDVPRFNVLDGLSLRTYPDRAGLSRIQGDSLGDFFSFDNSGILRFHGEEWRHSPLADLSAFRGFGYYGHASWFEYPVITDPDPRVTAVASGPGRMLIAFPDKLVEWSSAYGAKLIRRASDTGLGRFADIAASEGNGFLLSGQNGVAVISRDLSRWNESPAPSGRPRLVYPFRMNDGSLLVTSAPAGDMKYLLTLREGRWKELWSAKGRQLRAWQTTGGEVWAADDEQLVHFTASGPQKIRLEPMLTGHILDVLPDGHSFWVGTQQGVARYSPALWQVPDNAPDVHAIVNVITEDRAGTLWFSGYGRILSFDRKQWREFPTPRGRRVEAGKTSVLCPLANGKVLLATQDATDLLELDPASGVFRSLPHPEGRTIRWIGPRDSSTVWVQTISAAEKTSRLETFDGASFQPLAGGERIPGTDIRTVFKSRTGAIWVGGTSVLGTISNGRFESFTPDTFPPELSAFSLAEASNGTVYVGHRSSISLFDGKRFRLLRKGFDRVRRLTLDREGTLWAASGTGVDRYRNGQWLTNGAAEGLPADPVYTVFIDSRNQVWAGTTLGLSVYHPESDSEPPVTLLEEDQNLRQSAPGGEVRFAFSGVDRWKKTPASRLLFSWRLDGGAWSPFDRSSYAALRSLPSGGHSFEVRAMDRNGNIDPSPAHFEFSVLYPWYRESGFYLIAGLAAFAIALLVRKGYAYHRDLRFRSRHDLLTGLPNRLSFEEALTEAVEKPRSGIHGAAVLFIDLDGFKAVNDALGHSEGDKVLIRVGRALDTALRRGDLLARMGGDEFAILLNPVTDPLIVSAMADRLLAAIRSCSPDPAFPVFGSIGVSLWPENSVTANGLLRLADVAMYQSKARNGDCVLFYDPEMRVDFRSARISGMLRDALRENRLSLCYQPIVDLRGRIEKMECLVRLNDPVSGLIPPSVFIPVAEQTGLIHAVGDWVFGEALRTAMRWRQDGAEIPIAVNVSPVQLDRAGLSDEILRKLNEAGLPPELLTVEVTEGAIARNQDRAVLELSRLRAAGARISLDDFGTGYSSLSMIDSIPLDEIKLDRSFARSIGGERTRDVIAQTLTLAAKLGVKVVTEGIEKQQELDAALALGCELFQGYLIAAPLDSAAAAEFIDAAAQIDVRHELAGIR